MNHRFKLEAVENFWGIPFYIFRCRRCTMGFYIAKWLFNGKPAPNDPLKKVGSCGKRRP